MSNCAKGTRLTTRRLWRPKRHHWYRVAMCLCMLGRPLTQILRVDAFHDCVQSRKRARKRGHRRLRQHRLVPDNVPNSSAQPSCAGGICVGMTNGPHQGGNASYPIAWNGTAGTRLKSYMTVPDYPSNLATKDGFSEITYYIWTDVFFGDEAFGRMNQLVPQLILGSALDGSSGPPRYDPEWNAIHDKWSFGAHYFFEVWNPTTNTTDAHAAYGKLFPTVPGETLLTTFELSLPDSVQSRSDEIPRYIRSDLVDTIETNDSLSPSFSAASPAWTLTMSVVGDPTRKSVLTVSEPYMGIGKDWKPRSSSSWLEPNFRNMCINACWELYGASDPGKLPASGAEYRLLIEQPEPALSISMVQSGVHADHNFDDDLDLELQPDLSATISSPGDVQSHYYDFTTWEQDEGNGVCPSCGVSEVHDHQMQQVFVMIDVASSDDFPTETEEA